MATGTVDDAWLHEVLSTGDWLGEPDATGRMAAALAARDPAVDGSGAATRVLLAALADAWERGWQPADVVHTVRRVAPARAVPLVVGLIAEHARACDAAPRAPAPWVAQLADLGALTAGDPAVVAAWHRAAERPAAEAWRVVLALAAALRGLARIDVLAPPPSRWGGGGPRTAPEPGIDDARVLRRIRALLAKAESTGFPDEAESLTAKAQELMARHAVDATLLTTGRDGSRTGGPGAPDVGTRRVHLQEPYVRAKLQLLTAVSEANDVRVVWYGSLGIVNLVGTTADLAAVELLFTSLLLQVGQALTAAERASGRHPASRTFRRAFLLGYAHRVGERLAAARRQATAEAAAEHGVDLLPVLRSRDEAVAEAFAQLFPRVRTSRSRASVDAGGWHAGRAAAERADVGPRRSAVR
jgi:hypothetical protein